MYGVLNKFVEIILRAKTQISLILRNWHSEEAKGQYPLSKKVCWNLDKAYVLSRRNFFYVFFEHIMYM